MFADNGKPMLMDIYEIRRQNLAILVRNRKKKDCAELWETSPSFISQILSKNPVRNLGDDLARRIESAELLPHGYLDQIHEDSWDELALRHSQKPPKPKAGELEIVAGIAPWGSETPLEDDEVEVPLYKEVELAAGVGSEIIHEIPSRFIRFARSTLRDAGVEPANAIAATVSGNSMERLITEGSTIGIDTGTTNIIDGEIYAIRHDGMLRVKYLYRHPGGGLRLRSENSEEHPDEFYSAEHVQEYIRVIGWVFWISTVRRRRGGLL